MRVPTCVLLLAACNGVGVPPTPFIFELVETGGPGFGSNVGQAPESLGDRSGVTAILGEQEFTFEGLTAYEDGTLTAYDTDPNDPSTHTLQRRWLIEGVSFGVGYQPCGPNGPAVTLTLADQTVSADDCTLFVTLINQDAVEGHFSGYFSPENQDFPSGDILRGYFRMRP